MTLTAFINETITRFLPEAVPYRILLIVLCYGTLTSDLPGQTQKPPAPQQPDDVIRINTELVQTDVMVFDKKGHFVDGPSRTAKLAVFS